MLKVEAVNRNISNHRENGGEPSTALRCGIFGWRPDFLQIGYNWKLGLVLFCWFSFLNGILSNGLNAVNTSSLERRFDVDSEQIGWLAASGMFSLASTTIVTSYYAEQTSNKPRMLAFAGFCYAIGSFLLALPHFIMPPYEILSEEAPYLCRSETANFTKIYQSAANWTSSGACYSSGPANYFRILIAGNVVIGVGAAVVWTIGVAFVDDFSTTAKSSLNVGITYLVNAIGAGVGFGIGSVFLIIDVNLDKSGIPPQNPESASFLGAWWLGYAICIGLFATVAIGFLFFDKELPETATLQAEKLAHAETHVNSKNGPNGAKLESAALARGHNKFIAVLVAFVDHLVCLIKNPVVLWTTIAASLQCLTINSLQNFMVKLFQTQYGLSEMSAGMAIAVLIVVGIASGCFLSGLMAERLEMSVRNLLLVTIAFSILSLTASFVVMLNCGQQKIVGVTYDGNSSSFYPETQEFSTSDLRLSCNAQCQCDPKYYYPVCNTDVNVEYYSPCYAGCLHFGTNSQSNKTDYSTFTSCACVHRGERQQSLKYGHCGNSEDGGDSCPTMYGAMAGIFFILFCGFFIIVSVTEVLMRTVTLEERSFSLAFNQAVQYFLGSIPGPIFMGVIFDQSCILRQPLPCNSFNNRTDDDFGACVVYNSNILSWWLTGVLCGFAFLSIICYIVAFVFYKPSNGETLQQYFRNLFIKFGLNKFRCRNGNKRSKRRTRNIVYDVPPVPLTITPLESFQSISTPNFTL